MVLVGPSESLVGSSETCLLRTSKIPTLQCENMDVTKCPINGFRVKLPVAIKSPAQKAYGNFEILPQKFQNGSGQIDQIMVLGSN